MKIDFILPYLRGRGGIEKVLIEVCNKLSEKNHEVKVFQYSKPSYDSFINSIENFYYFKDEVSQDDKLEDFAFKYTEKLKILGPPDIIVALDESLSFICKSATSAFSDKQIPLILYLHKESLSISQKNSLMIFDGYFVPCKNMKKQLESLINRKSYIYILENPIDTSNCKIIKQCNEKLKLYYIGKLKNEEKGIDLIFNALSLIKDDFDYELNIFGDGEDEKKLRDYARSLNIGNHVIFHGYDDNPFDSIDEATAVILSSHTEGFGLVTLETLKHGLPIISSKCGASEEIIVNDENGWLFDKNNYKQLYEILKDIHEKKKFLPSYESCISSIKFYESEKIISKMEYFLNKHICLYETLNSLQQSPQTLESTVNTIEKFESQYGEDIKLYDFYTYVLLKENKFNKSLEIISKGLEIDEFYGPLYEKKGYVYVKENDILNSIKNYYKSLELATTTQDISRITPTLQVLSKILLQNFLENNSLEFIEKYDDIVGNINFSSPEYDIFLLKKSEIYENHNLLDKALRTYKTLILNSSNEDYKKHSLLKINEIHNKYKENSLDEKSYIKMDFKNKNSKADLISLCMLTYENLQYSFETLDSFLNQDYANLEIIIGDDNSNNFDMEVYKNYILKNKKNNICRIIIYKNDLNLGIVSNFNKAISLSSGKYFKLLGCGDVIYSSNIISEMYKNMKNNDSYIVMGSMEVCDLNLNKTSLFEISKVYIELCRDSDKLFNTLMINNVIPAPGIFFNKEVFSKYGLLNENFYLMEDVPYWIKLSYEHCKMSCFHDLCVKYRVGDGISTSLSQNKYYEKDLIKFSYLKQKYKNSFDNRLFLSNLILKNNSNLIYGKNNSANIKTIFNGEGKVYTGDNVVFGYELSPHFYGFHNLIQARYNNSVIKIGHNTILSNDISIIAAKLISIGNSCLIGDRVNIMDFDAHGLNPIDRLSSIGEVSEVIIKDNVWIGSCSTILKGVTIGNNSVVGCNSVVTKDVPDNCVVAGNPAKIIKYL